MCREESERTDLARNAVNVDDEMMRGKGKPGDIRESSVRMRLALNFDIVVTFCLVIEV